MKKLNTFFAAMLFVVAGIAQDSVNITLTLNMQNEMFDPANVYVAGGGNFGNPGDFQMDDSDGDSVFTITVRRPMGFTSFYTFTNGNCSDYSCKENLSGLPCGDPANFNDRSMGPVMSDTTIQHCFGQCTTDGSCDAPATQVEVTFNVNVAGFPLDSTVNLGANFDGWSGGLVMEDPDGDSIYSYTAMLDPGIQYEYKFITDGNWEDIDSLDGQSCVMNFGGFINRIVTPTSDTSVCYDLGRCNSCAAVPPAPANVTFSVDMSNITVDPAGVFLGANFDGWSGSLGMTDMGDGEWAITIPLDPGPIEFKYINGTSWENLDPIDGQPCVVNFGGFVNRVDTVGSEDMEVCFVFEECTDCKSVGINDVVTDLVSVRPTRVQDNFEIAFTTARAGSYNVEVMDLMGRAAYRTQIAGTTQSHQVNTAGWAKGIYLVRTSTKTQQQTVKILVE